MENFRTNPLEKDLFGLSQRKFTGAIILYGKII